MATQNPLLSRMRLTRMSAANPPKNASATSTASSAETLTKPSKPSHETQPPISCSNVSVFLTNLRLLDLDLLPDWPDINSLTFTNKDAAQGQKKRVQSVEWALYHLFVLWDPEEARNKLQPFFPPLDQVQSVNLRAALLRCLEQAKKNGVLGRDTVLRKTMLDECKGDRLQEVLAVFSSAVLKKIVLEQQLNSNAHPAVAQTSALQNRGYSGERSELNMLILAHKVSLTKKLDRKQASRAQFKSFAELLDQKERSISRRREHAKSEGAKDKTSALSDRDKADVRRAVRNNWSGNERWMETVLYGDSKTRQDGVLAAPFDRVWRRVQSDRLGELEDESGGLLEQLESRVRIQQDRLGKWQRFQNDMFGDTKDGPEKQGTGKIGHEKGIDLGFGAHETLQLGGSSLQKLALGKTLTLEGEYGQLIDGLEADLKKINQGSGAPDFSRWRRGQPTQRSTQSSSSDKAADEPLSELSELEEELAKPSLPAQSRPLSMSSKQNQGRTVGPDGALRRPEKSSKPKLPQPKSSMHALRPKAAPPEVSPIEATKPQVPMKAKAPSPRHSPVRETQKKSSPSLHSPVRDAPPSPSRSPPRNLPPRRIQPPEEIPPSPTQLQADQILASMNEASPSPVKKAKPRHTLSLADRTRMSLTRGPSLYDDDDNGDDLGISSPTRLLHKRGTSSKSSTKSKATTPTTAVTEEDDDTMMMMSAEDDLVARTRKSMVNFEAAQQRARLERQRSLRREAREQQQSSAIARHKYFPSVDEDGAAEEGGEKTAVLEELMESEAGRGADYESIFKSRPRIKTSPPSTPAREGGHEWE